MQRITAAILGALMLAMAGPAAASMIGTTHFLYDDDDPDGSRARIEFGLSDLDPDRTSGTVGSFIIKAAFLFEAENARLLMGHPTDVVDPTAGGNLSLDWSMEYIGDGSLEELMLTEIFDFAHDRRPFYNRWRFFKRWRSYKHWHSLDPDWGGGGIQEIPLPPAIALLGTGILFLFGFAGPRRRSTTG